MSLDMWLPRLPFAHRLTGNIHRVCKLFLGKAFSRRSRTRLSAKVILISPFVFDGLIIACSPFCAPPTCALQFVNRRLRVLFLLFTKQKGPRRGAARKTSGECGQRFISLTGAAALYSRRPVLIQPCKQPVDFLAAFFIHPPQARRLPCITQSAAFIPSCVPHSGPLWLFGGMMRVALPVIIPRPPSGKIFVQRRLYCRPVVFRAQTIDPDCAPAVPF